VVESPVLAQNTLAPAFGPDSATASAQARAVLELRGVVAQHERVRVIFGIDLTVRAGEILAIVGPNGAGKSSLLGAVAGLVRSSGTMLLAGKPLHGLAAHRRAQGGLAFVPEARGNLFGALSVEENLQVALRLLSASARDALREDIFELFPILKQRMRAPASMLSGGEQQMLSIAMALGRVPKALLLDEPTQGLAPSVFDILLRAFARLKQRGLALVLAEQNLPFAARSADRYIVLAGGRIALQGPKEELADRTRIMDAYLGG